MRCWLDSSDWQQHLEGWGWGWHRLCSTLAIWFNKELKHYQWWGCSCKLWGQRVVMMLSMHSNGVSFVYLDVLLLMSVIVIYREFHVLSMKNGISMELARKLWVSLILLAILEVMLFASFFAPLFQCHFNNYMITVDRTESLTVFINTAFLLLSGYVMNIFWCSLQLCQVGLTIVSLMIACLLGASFLIGHFSEIQVSNVPFNANCYRTSLLTLGASHFGLVWWWLVQRL